MAMHHTTPLTALAIAARLVRANIPFTINVQSLTRADIECKFEEVLGEAVMQQCREDNRRVSVDSEEWYAATPDGDSALVTRVKALCNHPSMSFHQVALLDGAISEAARLPLCDDGHCDHAATSHVCVSLNDWEDATHQVTFDNGANWTNVKLKYGYYLACSDGKRSWRADSIDAANVVKRPEAK